MKARHQKIVVDRVEETADVRVHDVIMTATARQA